MLLAKLALARPAPVALAFALHLAVGSNAEWDQIGGEQWHQFAPCEVAEEERLTVIDQTQERTDHQGSFQRTHDGIAFEGVRDDRLERAKPLTEWGAQVHVLIPHVFRRGRLHKGR